MVGARMETGRGSLSALPPQEAGTSSVYPLRPLNLNEIFAAALAIIRHSPKAALGIPFVAGTITLLLTLLTYAVAPSSMNRILADPLAYEDQEMALSLMGEASFLAVTALTGFVSSLLWVAAATLLIIPALRSGLGLKTSFGQALRHPPAVWGWLSLHLLMLTVLLFVGLMVGAFVALFIIIITLFIGAVVVVPVSLLALAWITTALLHAPW
ncbi:hypothetical protein [Nesterenkonia sp. NBAIMH1]|uniref:hypothetical protein n=1 Tax=Nesterenkonia sp. NBAIMH1 TaxID=2600320 RepID=UPI0011B36E6B|nr:hypothetical protein [Nesterenkonia sp. NBAIMH1]